MLFFLISICFSTLDIIPEPKEVIIGTGDFSLKSNTGIFYDKTVDGLLDIINYAAKLLRISTGYAFEYKDSSSSNQINFVKSTSELGSEEYQLSVKPDQVIITATTPIGFLYGFETLLQLFPAEIYSKKTMLNIQWTSPCVDINDAPRFKWRGILIDPSRHFLTVDSLKALFDSMAHQKLNYVHLHLNDDQGWRIEIKKYPKFTEIGSIASGRPKPWFRSESDETQYGPFYYTQEQLKELDRYARTRGVIIVPEIDLPGHAVAGLSAYPELSCTGGPFEPLWHMNPSPEVFCLGNDQTIQVLKDVLDEVMGLFETKYIHIGGDECQTARWEKCPKCQKRYQDLKMTNIRQLQNWFTEQLLSHIREKGYKAIGWDEIYYDDISKDVTIMGWHKNVGTKAANNGLKVIMTPSTLVYICQYQYTVPDVFEYATFGYKTLYVSYNYEPTDGVSADHQDNVLGVQGSLWAEWVWGGDEDLYYKLYPRMIAIGESGWTQKSKRNFNRFLRSLIRKHQSRLQNAQIIYAPAGQAQNVFWNSDDVKAGTWVTKEWKLGNKAVGKAGPYEAAFILKNGQNGINIKNVHMRINGKIIAVSEQEGQATWDDNQANAFKLVTNENASEKEVSLFADIQGIDGNDSEGEVVLYYTNNT
ncbi:hypothetical protein M9Y10_036334 [Tritrichomonas musculus]|uniref:beta-N-acetylhexosaminidase n=1 Tax=Tritrichomonas musculus TaxID=1915356 RepID=A0ABR2GVW2_9EUKA